MLAETVILHSRRQATFKGSFCEPAGVKMFLQGPFELTIKLVCDLRRVGCQQMAKASLHSYINSSKVS